MSKPQATETFFASRPNAVADVTGEILDITYGPNGDPTQDRVLILLAADVEELGLREGEEVALAMSSHPMDANRLLRDLVEEAGVGASVRFTGCTSHTRDEPVSSVEGYVSALTGGTDPSDLMALVQASDYEVTEPAPAPGRRI